MSDKLAPRDAVTVTGMVDGVIGNTVVGWALDTQSAEPCRIEIVGNAGEILTRAVADQTRQDLTAYGFGRSDFAFRLALPAFPAQAEWRVLADGAELSGSPLQIGTGIFDGAICISGGQAEGWVQQRNEDPAPLTVTILDQDGVSVGQTVASVLQSSSKDRFAPARFTLALPPWVWRHKELGLRAFVGRTMFATAAGSLTLKGHLDQIDHARCVGWLLSPEAPDIRFPIEIWSGDRVIARGHANMPRDDLRDTYPRGWRSGFDIRIDPPLTDQQPHELTLRIAEGGGDLFAGTVLIGRRKTLIPVAHDVMARMGELQLSAAEQSVLRHVMAQFLEACREQPALLDRLAAPSASSGPRPFRVVIPIYKDIEATRACIESVLAHHGGASSVILVNDASPDEGMAECLAGFSHDPLVQILTNPTNRGFVQSVNRALDFCSDGDVILLNSDTRVFAGGLKELSSIANAQEGIGTVTAISNNATIFSYPVADEPCQQLDDIGWQEVAAVALQDNCGKIVDVPTGHGFCILLTQNLLRSVGKLDECFGRGYGEENDLCVRGADLGLRNVAAPGAFVEHRESVSFGLEKPELLKAHLEILETRYPEYAGAVRVALENDDLRTGRWAIDAARLSRATATRPETGFVLVIRNWLGGGTQKALGDVAKTLDAHLELLDLSVSDNGVMVLSTPVPRIRASFTAAEELQLFALLDSMKIAQIHIHQLLGFPAAFIRTLQQWCRGRAVRYHLHDYYPICPRVVLLDAASQFCRAPPADVCERCVELGGAHEASRMNEIAPALHRELFNDLLSNADVVSPSASAASLVHRIFPDLQIRVVPHPENSADYRLPVREGNLTDIVVLGAIGPHKGSALLRAVAERARLFAPDIRFHVLGYTNIDAELLRIGNVLVTGRYAATELPGLVTASGGRLALFLHGWPETFSYTLSEAVQFGLIPLVPDIGAPAERVRAAGFGHIFPFPSDAASLVELLLDISEGRIDPAGGGTPADFAPTS